MGIGGISIWQLLIILLIVVLVFGTKRLKSMGTDLGGAVKGFRKAMSDEDKAAEAEKSSEDAAKIDASDASGAKDTETRTEEKHHS